MKTCILVIVKNEHTYLNDFITYHLNLGINHLFVFEDINSMSHKEITDKYDSVTLNSIKFLYPEINFTHNQHEYFRRSIEYIKKNYDYDFCFCIDIDEYITLKEENLKVNEVIERYSNFDALVLQWQNYGANGLIYQPKYDKPIQDIYTQKTGMSCNDRQYISTKVCYNLKTFERKNYNSNHLPSIFCNWCKPDFSNDTKSQVYDVIYIRHYITKSFEEFVNKVYIRGLFSHYHRNWNDFFSLNPDMEDKREELIKLGEEMISKSLL